jgi:hypothetical protein
MQRQLTIRCLPTDGELPELVAQQAWGQGHRGTGKGERMHSINKYWDLY